MGYARFKSSIMYSISYWMKICKNKQYSTYSKQVLNNTKPPSSFSKCAPLKGGFGPKLNLTESQLNIILDGGKHISGFQMVCHQLQLAVSPDPTCRVRKSNPGPFQLEPNHRNGHISINVPRRTKLQKMKVYYFSILIHFCVTQFCPTIHIY